MPMLTQWESEKRLTGMVLATGLLKGEQAQSLLLIGPPGQGKTSMIRCFEQLPTVRLVSDLTSFGVRNILRRDEQGAIRHLLMPELERVFSRDRSVSSQTANLICNLMTGDAGVEIIGREEYDFSNRQMGVIGAMTSDVFKQRREFMRDTGMLSRFILVPVDRSEEERARVVRAILAANAADLRPVHWPQMRGPARWVRGAEKFASKLHQWLDAMSVSVDERLASRMLVLLKACALLNGRDVVTDHDFRTLKSFGPFFEQKKNVTLNWPVA